MTNTNTSTSQDFVWNDQPITSKHCCGCFVMWRRKKQTLGMRNRVKYGSCNINKIDKDAETYSIVVVATNINNDASPLVTIGKYMNYDSFKQAFMKLSREKILELVSAEIKSEIHPLHRLVVNIVVTPKPVSTRQLSFTQASTPELVTQQSTPSKLIKALSGRFTKKSKEDNEDPNDLGINIEKELSITPT